MVIDDKKHPFLQGSFNLEGSLNSFARGKAAFLYVINFKLALSAYSPPFFFAANSYQYPQSIASDTLTFHKKSQADLPGFHSSKTFLAHGVEIKVLQKIFLKRTISYCL